VFSHIIPHFGGHMKMTDVKDPTTLHSEDVSNSDVDDNEKGRRPSIAGGHAESLNDLDDPDAGKTAEERAAIVRVDLVRVQRVMVTNMFAGQEACEKNRFLADPVALFALSAQFPG
jgi:hypothetical protein